MAEPKQNLTGVWHGLYSYSRHREPVYFVATLIHLGAMVSGSIHESEVGRRGAPLKLFAHVSGTKLGTAVSFTKVYDGSGGWDHAVDYDGTLNGDGSEIEGMWEIKTEAGCGGRFLMIRNPGASETATREIFEKA
jgi:hypothetical protein